MFTGNMTMSIGNAGIQNLMKFVNIKINTNKTAWSGSRTE